MASKRTIAEDFELDGDTLASRDGTSSPESDPGLAPGTQAGRYLILDQLGHGGMGIVYKAYDPELDRRIALKLLRVKTGSQSQADRARDRLLREAKALAQLSHPNVVSAYDVGTLDQDVFVAMELVEGKTLKEWVQEDQPSVYARVEALVAAGRGIAAAHQAGLIHRDIKPDNIIVGDDGRVRVLDFGLARAALSEEPPARGEANRPVPVLSGELTSGGSFLSSPMTQAGTIVGTPGYMAPEQYLGGQVDEQSDQYSFCVTLYEVLYGQRPHGAKRYGELKEKVLTGKIDPTPADRKVPARYRKIALRGLSVARENRFPSLAELLADLAKDPRTRRRRWLAFAAVTLLVAASFTGAYALQAQKQQLCAGATSQLADIWNDDRKDQIKKAFTATARLYAADTYARVERIVSRYAGDWAAMHTDACEATHLRGEQSESLLDKRMACLQRRRSELKALLELYAQKADAEVVDKAVPAATGLSRLSACADTESLLAAVPPPAGAETKNQVNKLREKLDEALALEKAGKYQLALPLAKDASKAAQQIDYPPIRAESLFRLGVLQSMIGKPSEAENTLYQAARAAALAKDVALLARVSTGLVSVLGDKQARLGEALAISRLAEANVAQAGDDPLLLAGALYNLAVVYARQGKYPEAKTRFERVLALRKKVLPDDHLQMAGAHHALGVANEELGNKDQAQKHYQRALSIWENTLGPDHPDVARALNGLGTRAHLERALTIWQNTLGHQHVNVGAVLNNLAGVLYAEKEYRLASQRYQQAVEVLEKALGPDHPYLCFALSGLGRSLTKQKKASQALAPLERALALHQAHPSDPAELAQTQFDLARALHQCRQDRKRSLHLAHQAREIMKKAGTRKAALREEIETWFKMRDRAVNEMKR